MRFVERNHYYNIIINSRLQYCGGREGVRAEVTATHHSEDSVKIINEGVCTKQIFSVHKSASFQTRMPLRTFIAREKSSPGFKASKNRLASS